MNIRALQPSEQGIKAVKCEVYKDKFVITWQWPENCDVVYIYKGKAFEDIDIDDINSKNTKIYTREEYREFNGYVESIREVNQYKYMIFKAVESENKITLVKQHNEENEVIVCTGKPDIEYEIKEQKSLFSKTKKVYIKVICEMPIKKDVLCYVKKQGAYPAHKDDGIKFDFVMDFNTGVNEMPPVEIGKNEFIKLFIKDEEKFGNAYNLKF